MNIVHFIMTRFKLKFESSKVNNEKTQSDAWFDGRLIKFERYLYPSIINQTDQNFHWFTFSTEGYIKHSEKIRISKYKRAIHTYCTDITNEPKKDVYEDMPNFNEVRKTITPYIPNNTDLVLSTRVDTDDALNVDFVKRIKEYALEVIKKQNPPFIITPLNGVLYCNNEFREVQKYYWNGRKANMFSTVVDTYNPDYKLIYDHPHPAWGNYIKIIRCTEYDRMFLQHIHDENIYSNTKTIKKWFDQEETKPISKKTIMREFCLDEDIFN